MNVTVPHYGSIPATIQQPEERNLGAEEGGMVTMQCDASGVPKPSISWIKYNEMVQIYRFNYN